jgi:hypothetical protein
MRVIEKKSQSLNERGGHQKGYREGLWLGTGEGVMEVGVGVGERT